MGRLVQKSIKGGKENHCSYSGGLAINTGIELENKRDEELIKDFVDNDDERAFNILLKKYENIVYGLAYRILGNHCLSEEVMQEVFLILTTKLSTFREEAKFSTWLYRVVVNVCYLYKKTEYKHNTNLRLDQDINGDGNSQFIDYLQDNRSSSHYEESRSSEIVEMVERELKNLPEKYRVVFVLRDVEGLTNPEVSKVLGISLAAVKSRILRARKFLKSRLQNKLK
ncbi:MAG: sigma-70 family RNA polymerase sigma factor [Candidatus Dadabacteria bacterium]|nr:sigma-70 family RNA polymerase sigma factor [Candidatus Dadabacteria bacterium]NIS08299.1 sigma-70 family RNA polymerase sigma factor [Candidatus Dadabacteria bacterium]NIV41647.1 sigma-70 family RNA polymerase sigma factor [Candidatus Dadabacteria bacterium]NIY21818.1 sigma-70 family RNA polymerase sigma factor [Candidatus Dadabacteria bacterium]